MANSGINVRYQRPTLFSRHFADSHSVKRGGRTLLRQLVSCRQFPTVTTLKFTRLSDHMPALRKFYDALRPAGSRLFAIPIIGYCSRIVVGFLKLPRITWHIRRLDGEIQRRAAEARELISRVEWLEQHALTPEGTTGDRVARLELLVAQLPRLAEAVTAGQTAVRAMQRAVPGPAAATPASFQVPLIDPQIEVVPELLLRREAPRSFNRLPRMADWAVGGALSRRMTELREPHTMHRKQWEYAMCLEGLHAMGVVHPEASAIAVGAGTERPLFYYANEISRMVATDLYDNPAHEGQPAMLTDPSRFAPFPYRQDRLEVVRMAGDALAFPDNSFDFAFCLSSIEHFGSRATQRNALDEMARVVRPGGGVCIITELVLNGERHAEYFLPSELQDVFLEHPMLRLEGGSPEWRISDLLIECPIDVRVEQDLASAPHLVLFDGRVLWTSASLFFRKQR